MLPSLETLYLHRKSQSVGVSVLGLQHLRRLVVKGKHVLEALHDPSCQLYVHGDGYAMRLSKSKPLIPGRRSLGATSDFIIGGCNYMGGPANPTYPESLATRGHWADMETLTVKWAFGLACTQLWAQRLHIQTSVHCTGMLYDDPYAGHSD